jgi:very-short-patch-repair endonuclease
MLPQRQIPAPTLASHEEGACRSTFEPGDPALIHNPLSVLKLGREAIPQMATLRSLVDAPEHLLATHDRLRRSGFPVVTIVNAHAQLDARVWYCRWAQTRGRSVIRAPEANTETALAAYRARTRGSPNPLTDPPALLIPGEFRQALAAAVALTGQHPQVPAVIASGITSIVENLLNMNTPQELVVAALQGLIPVEDTTREVVTQVAGVRNLQPFLRGACEGLLYYMLEARPETRGRFSTNVRITNAIGSRTHEVDLACVEAGLIVELDGPEHNSSEREAMDTKKQKDLENQGYRILRFSNEQVIEQPVGVWRLIIEQLNTRGSQ